MRKFLIYISFLFLLVLLTFCEEKIFTIDVDCEECYYNKPDSVDLIIHWSQSDEFQEIPVVLFRGKVDLGVFIDTFYCFADPAYIWVKANEEYSAKAIYQTEERTVMVVDGTKQKLKRVSDACDAPCWVITDEELKLKLKF